MATNDSDLKKLIKALNQKASTSEALEHWQELLSRRPSIAASKSIQAAEVVSKLSGSWAASYALPESLATIKDPFASTELPVKQNDSSVRAKKQLSRSKIGQPGLPEINFTPYRHNTNAIGNKGPTLIGSHVSWSVVGPTLKSGDCDWQWEVDPATNQFTMVPGPLGQSSPDFVSAYGIADPADVEGGLYCMVAQSGDEAEGDGFGLYVGGDASVQINSTHGLDAKYQIFRVTAIAGDTITLDPAKPITLFYDLPLPGLNTYHVRGFTFLKPEAARMVAVPGSGPKGQECAFVVLPPAKSLNADLYPPKNIWDASNEPDAYGGSVNLPIPIPSTLADDDRDAYLIGYPEGEVFDGAPNNLPGYWRIHYIFNINGVVTSADVGKVVHVRRVLNYDKAAVDTDISDAEFSSMLGWYEIVEADNGGGFGDYVVLKRLIEVDPNTGKQFIGPGPFTKGLRFVEVEFTIHDPIETLWTDAYPNIDALDSARITNLIDPEWVARTSKLNGALNANQPGVTPARADRVIFDTTGGDPGSLLDLGFRAVVYPAKVSTSGELVPDFSKPIDSREVIIDPSVNELQTIDIDYASGIVTLSHQPPAAADPASQVYPNDLGAATDNPRGELVLFISYMAYSQEEEQVGTGVQITAGDLNAADFGIRDQIQRPAYSSPVYLPLVPNQTPLLASDSYLVELDVDDKFPPSGAFEIILHGSNTTENTYKESAGTYGYYKKETVNVGGTDYTALSGLWLAKPGQVGFPAVLATGGIAVLRRDYEELDYEYDTSYGDALRSKSFNLAYGDITVNKDGSVTLLPTAVAGPAQELRSQFPLGVSARDNSEPTEVARFYFDTTTQNWTAGSPPWATSGANQIGIDITRGTIFSSMSMDFADPTLDFEVFTNRASGIQPLTDDLSQWETPSSRYILTIDKGSADLPTDFLDIVPATEIADGPNALTAIVEGSTVATVTQPNWNSGGGSLTAGTRFIFNIKKFGDRSARDDLALELKLLDKAPANPLDWFAYTATGVESASNIATAINAFYSANRGCTPADTSIDSRVLLTERQISILPSRPYLQSADVTGGVTFSSDATYLLTVYSADPSIESRKKWITFTGRPNSGGPFASADADAIATFLNDHLDNGLHANYVGDALESAGFNRDNTGERQFVWIGPADARHPDGSNTVCLLCGGHGSNESGGSGNADFYNVMLEFGRTAGAVANDSVGDTLGGDFVPASVTEVARCGLFFGPSAQDRIDSGPNPPAPAAYSGQTVFGTANEELGFDPYGLAPLGQNVGSFPIETETNVSATVHEYEIRIPTGDSQYYSGPQAVPYRGYGRKSNATENHDIYQEDFGLFAEAFPYLGRWVWSSFPRTAIDLSVGTNAGLAHIWVSYGTVEHDERGFKCYLTADDLRGYQNFLLYAASVNGSELDPPTTAPGSINKGDLIFAHFNTGARIGNELAWEGIVYNVNAPVPTTGAIIPTAPSYSLTVLAKPRGYPATLGADHVHATGLQPSNIRTVTHFSTTQNGSEDGFDISIVPSPNSVTQSAVFKYLYPHSKGPSTFAKNGINVIGPDDGSGLDGGSSTVDDSAKSNAIIISGGRIDLMSLAGPSAPSGLSFSNPVVGSVNSGIRFAKTFLEHGVFTSSVSLGDSIWAPGAAQDHAGMFSVFRGSRNDRRFLDGRPLTDSARNAGHKVGGVAGVRFSGDTQVWLTNLQALASSTPTAFIRGRNIITEPPYNVVGTGPIGLMGGGFERFTDTHSEGLHIPSGFSASRSADTENDFELVLQEATVSIGLTRADYVAFLAATSSKSFSGSQDAVFGGLPGSVSAFGIGETARNSGIPIPVKFLSGCYLEIGTGTFDTPDPNTAANEGTWRVVAAPLLTSSFMPLNITESIVTVPATGYPFPASEYGYFPQTNLRQGDGYSETRILPPRQNIVPGTGSIGHQPASSFVAYIQVRVERYALIPTDGTVSDAFYAEEASAFGDGHVWAFYEDEQKLHPVYVATVVDPGGSPTGAPSSISGLTLNPKALGQKSTLPMDLVSVFSDTTTSETWDLVGRSKLFGIHESMDSKGRKFSQIYFSMEQANTPITGLSYDAYARAVIYSSQRDDRLDELSASNTRGEFEVDASGRVKFVGHTPRLSFGVVIDGGLGLVQATAFRSTPRPEVYDNIGSLSIHGHNAAYPGLNYYGEAGSNIAGLDLPSTFNRAEFHQKAIFVSPSGQISFEDSKAARGLPYNLKANLAALSEERSPLTYAAIRAGGFLSTDQFGSYFPNDSIFPFTTPGINFKTPGGVIYERPFRASDATGASIRRSAFTGKHSTGGIAGIEVPSIGEYMLLPKGPTNPQGVAGVANFKSLPLANSPLDLPLYEFTNSYGRTIRGGAFGINPGEIFSKIAPGASRSVLILPHTSSPGAVHAGYRHSHSRENGLVYGVDPILDSDFNMEEQFRVLDGMVLEDIDNGTFYTLGDVGRWKAYRDAGGTPLITELGETLNQPGNVAGDRPSTVGSIVCAGGFHANIVIDVDTPIDGDTVTITVRGVATVFTARNVPGAAPEFGINASNAITATNLANAINTIYGATTTIAVKAVTNGSTAVAIVANHPQYKLRTLAGSLNQIQYATSNAAAFTTLTGDANFNNGREFELIYDYGPYTNVRLSPFTDLSNGFGDRSDNGDVRRPLKGHRFRVTPNVEFVPVLGPRGVDGGLLPPLDGGQEIPYADAIFYSLTYNFKGPSTDHGEGDVGRFIYLCGTYDYAYTGWWVVIDVIPDYSLNIGPSGAIAETRDVAVVRKWNRGDGVVPPVEEAFSATDPLVLRGGFPLVPRPPLLRMSADAQTNDGWWDGGLFYEPDPTNNYSDLIMEVTNSAGTNIYSVVVTAATLAANSVVDCASLVTYANSVASLNGGSVPIPGGPVAGWIVWNVETNDMFDKGVTVNVTYNTQALDTAQRAEVLGGRATLRIQFYSNTAVSLSSTGIVVVGHNAADDETAVGFYSYKGANSQIDRTVGDRNNAGFITSPAVNDPNVAADYQGESASRGLRWVFSSPLLEEHVGSYLHLTKYNLHRFGVQLPSQDDTGVGGIAALEDAWTSGHPGVGDTFNDGVFNMVDIYRINRCANSGHLVVGGDCEVFHPEIVESLSEKGRPILYSPLSVLGAWQDTDTGDFMLGAQYRSYALQPVAREKIVTISPNNARSNIITGRGELAGPRGTGVLAGNNDPSATADNTNILHLGEPWVLKDRFSVTRTRIAENRDPGLANPWAGTNQYGVHFNDNIELNNANTNRPQDGTYGTPADSVYTWTPAGEWWELMFPQGYQQSNQYDASCPHPTLRIDLTESFTQAMQPGGGINSPYVGHQPKGARLTRIWVNFGVWGNEVTNTEGDNTPGYVVGTNENDALLPFYMAFNLVLEIPGSQARGDLPSNSQPLGTGGSSTPFGGRAPTAAYNHPSNRDESYPGGTIVVPLYCNREAGDLMPNTMERWVSAGPEPVFNSFKFGQPNPNSDWLVGDYEFGFGCATDTNAEIYQRTATGQDDLIASSHHPILWGSVDFGSTFLSREYSRVLASPFPRSSRVSGGIRSPFTSGVVPDGTIFKQALPESLSAAALTGIVITHGATQPAPAPAEAGSFDEPTAGPLEMDSPRTCGHAFTMALTPVGDFFDEPGPVRPSTDTGQRIATVGRTLDPGFATDPTGTNQFGIPNLAAPNYRRFKVGNWLDLILDRYGVARAAGSMLPPGARVYLEVTAGPGPGARPLQGAASSVGAPNDPTATGCWVGQVKCAFDVETADGTAYTRNVNNLGHDE